MALLLIINIEVIKLDLKYFGEILIICFQAALKLIGAVGGRITVFTTCLPTVGSGALSLREEPCDRSSVDVKHLGPSTDFYKTYALDCSHKQVYIFAWYLLKIYV